MKEKFSQEWKDKISATLKDKYKRGLLKSGFKKGFKMPEEWKIKVYTPERNKKISESIKNYYKLHKYYILSPESRKNKSEVARKKFIENNPMKNPISKEKVRLANLGRHVPEERKKRISETLKRMGIPKEQRIKMTNALKEKYKNTPRKKIILTEEHKDKLRKTVVNASKSRTKETFIKIGMKQRGKRVSEDFKKRMKESRAKQVFPKKDSSIEVKIQNFLKQLNIEFFTHQYIREVEHGYQCDIFVPSLNLVIECDGDYWHKYPTGRDIDHIRTKELIEKGFKVLRLWESEINIMDIDKFREQIDKYGI